MPSKSFLFVQEPKWFQHRQGSRHGLPENVQSWTYEAGSLTQRLRDYYGNAVSVKILFHQWRIPFLSERRLLRVHEQHYCLTREVLLHAEGTPLLVARTIIPAKTVKGVHRNLSHLGNRPLGEVIFSYPKLERLEMDVALVEPSAWSRAAIETAAINQPTWGRRTVYAIVHRQMLVSEFFLPDALRL
ncbi:MAG: chorismate lyase [Methylococcaceae bacterium]|nr:chorismate lyase [Methylococcaceae bacterium]